MRTTRRFPALSLSVVAAAACTVPGCGLVGGVTPTPVAAVPPPDLSEPPVAAAAGAEAGLEVTQVVATCGRQKLAAALLRFTEVFPPVPAPTRELWAANGLHLIPIPMDRWPQLARELGIAGGAQRQWTAPGASWQEVVRGPEIPAGTTIALDAERLQLDAGRLRMLARCWLVPVPPPTVGAAHAASEADATLIIEMVPQLKQPSARWSPLGPTSGERTLQDEGLLFSRLRLQLAASDSSPAAQTAYLLVPRRPDQSWREIAEAPSSTPGDDVSEHAAPGVGQVTRESQGDRAARLRRDEVSADAGPPAAAVPTLGEAIFGHERPRLSADGAELPQRPPPGDAIVVLIPRVPDRYELMPARRSDRQ